MAGEDFADYLRRHILTSGVGSQSALARETGIDVTYINRIAKGRILRPEIETLQKIAPKIRRPIEEVMLAAGYPAPRGTWGAIRPRSPQGTQFKPEGFMIPIIPNRQYHNTTVTYQFRPEMPGTYWFDILLMQDTIGSIALQVAYQEVSSDTPVPPGVEPAGD